MRKYIIASIDKQLTIECRNGSEIIEAQRVANEWGQMVVLKNSKGKAIRNFRPE